MTSTSCLYFSRKITVMYHQILTKHTVLCFHCLCVINSFDPHNHSLQCLFQPPKDWGGENVTVVPNCYHVMEYLKWNFKAHPLFFLQVLLATLQVQIQSVTGTHFFRKGKKLFLKKPLVKIIYLECFETQRKVYSEREKNPQWLMASVQEKDLTNL